MKFASLGSGSSGNATLIQSDDTLVLLDCGFTVKETTHRLQRFGLSPEDLSAVVLTHEHQDHAKGVAALSRKYKVPVYMTVGTHTSRDFGKIPELRLIRHYQSFSIGSLVVRPVVVPHDAKEPAQFIFQNADNVKLGILTDLGSITPHVEEAYRDCQGLLIEANHDLSMLHNGPYPPSLKSRVASHWGHLNNDQTANFLAAYPIEAVQQIVVGHISQKNNSVEKVRGALGDIVDRARSIHFACQDNGFEWLTLTR